MPRTAAQNKIIKDKKQEKILKNTLYIIAVKDYGEVTIDDITTEANCAHGLFYHYFNTKAEAYDALMERASEKKYASRLPKYEEDFSKGGLLALKALTSDIIKSSKEGNEEIAYYVLAALQQHFYGDAEIKSKDIYPEILKAIKDGQASGNIKGGSADDLARMYVDVMVGMLKRRLLQEDKYVALKEDSILSIFAAK